MATLERHTCPKVSTKQELWAVCVGIAVFACIFFVGTMTTIVIGRLTASVLPPNATEAYETIDGLGESMLCLFVGLGLSFLVAVAVGIMTAIRIADSGYGECGSGVAGVGGEGG